MTSSGDANALTTFTATGGVTLPEPGTIALLGVGLGAMLIGLRRTTKNAHLRRL